jgi:putative ABC transport system permease protein
MQLLPRLSSLLRNLFDKPRVERDLDAELRVYLEQLTDEKARSGMPLSEARRAALLELGGMEQTKEEVRGIRMGGMVETLFQDLRYGWRTLRKNPGFTAAAIFALALGIGANSAMFSVVYGILLRPLPYADADRVAMVYMHFSPQNAERGTMCIADYLDWRAQNHTFQDPSIYSSRRIDLAGRGEPEQVQGAFVSAGFFSTLGGQPLAGRLFLPGEDAPGSASTAVISESLWRRRFSGSPTAIGQTISVNGSAATIIGVMPGAFRLPRASTEIWTNLKIVPPTRRGPFFYRGIARLKPGVTLAQAQAETNAIGRRIMHENPYYKNLTLPVERLRDSMVGSVRTPLLVLIGAVGLVLLIAVVNVANLMLARATTREREMALRLGLGAGRGRLVRQLLTESVLLAVAGGAAGLAVSYGCIQLLRAWNPGNLPLIEYVQMDARALAFMFAVAVMTGLAFGLAPALQARHVDLNSTLKEGGRGATAGSSGRRTRAALVIAEIALSLMLSVGAGLLLRSLARLERVNGGFAARQQEILVTSISPSDRKYNEPPAVHQMYDRMLERVSHLPGVAAAALSDSLPPDWQADADTFRIEGQVLGFGESNPAVSVAIISPEYFRTMRIPLLKGRFFRDQDRQDSPLVTIVSESFARRFFPNQDPIGKRIKQSGADNDVPFMEIVGVVGDVKYTGLQSDSDETYYMPYRQNYARQMFVVARSPEGAGLSASLRREVQSVDPGVTVTQVETMEQWFTRAVARPQFNTLLLAVFAGIAVLLAAVGIYGIIAYSVAQRTHEIGVRMALGAARGSVLRMVIRQGAGLAAIGVGVGLAGAFVLTRLLSTLLFGVSTTDPLTFLAAAAGLVLIALAASLVPARRATRISPVVALRYE